MYFCLQHIITARSNAPVSSKASKLLGIRTPSRHLATLVCFKPCEEPVSGAGLHPFVKAGESLAGHQALSILDPRCFPMASKSPTDTTCSEGRRGLDYSSFGVPFWTGLPLRSVVEPDELGALHLWVATALLCHPGDVLGGPAMAGTCWRWHLETILLPDLRYQGANGLLKS